MYTTTNVLITIVAINLATYSCGTHLQSLTGLALAHLELTIATLSILLTIHLVKPPVSYLVANGAIIGMGILILTNIGMRLWWGLLNAPIFMDVVALLLFTGLVVNTHGDWFLIKLAGIAPKVGFIFDTSHKDAKYTRNH